MKNLKAIFLLALFVSTFACQPESKSSEKSTIKNAKVSIVIDFEGDLETINVENLIINNQASVREAMVVAREQKLLSFKDTLYTGMGHLLISFNNKEPYDSKYWFYCINGKKANQGIDGLKLSDGDIVKWVLTDDSNPCD